MVLLVLAGLLGLCGEVGLLEAGRRRDNAQLAAEAVAAKVQGARELAAGREWNKAIGLLHKALATEDAANLTEARQMLTEVQRSRAAALLHGAETAVAVKDITQALTLVEAYLADPAAAEKDRATRLRHDLELATSAAKAGELLRLLPDDTLAAFATDGTLPALEQIAAGPLREVYAATLRTQLAPEQQRRTEAAREAKAEQQKREARIYNTPAFRELQDFVAVNQKASGNDPRLLAYLMKQLNITNSADQKKALADLTARGQGTNLTAQVARQRIVLKDRFRSYAGFDETDRVSFERMVDGELDKLVRKGPAS